MDSDQTRDKDRSSGYQLILPDLSGIAKIVDDYSLPSFDKCLRDIITAYDNYNKSTQVRLDQLVDEHAIAKKQIKVLMNRVDQLVDLHVESANQIRALNARIDELTKAADKEEDKGLIESPVRDVQPEILLDEPAPPPISVIPVETYDPSAEIAEESDAPGIYYTVNPHYGENSIDGEGRIVVKGRHAKLAGKLTIINKEDSALFFDTLKEYQAVKVESCLISYLDQKIETIEIDDINRGMLDIKLSEIDSTFFPFELSYRIKYITKRN